VKRASNDTIAGRRYLELQREAKRTGRPTDELIQLYALECFLDRLVHSKFADTFVLKGVVLLAALDARRPTRDIDFAVRAIENTTEKVLSAVQTIASISLEDGMEFDFNGATAETIREEDSYSGIRVTLGGTLSRAVKAQAYLPADWWTLFQSQVLDELMRRALVDNPTVQAAKATLQTAMATCKAQRGALLLPAADAQVSATAEYRQAVLLALRDIADTLRALEADARTL
jgi:hypothetical protein